MEIPHPQPIYTSSLTSPYVDNFLTTNRKVCTIPESLGEVLDFFPVTL